MQNDFNQNEPTTPSPRSIAQGFTKDHLRSLQRSRDIDEPTRNRNTPLMEREVLRLCISNPDRLDELAAGRIDLKQYPSLAKHVIESSSVRNLDRSLAVMKKHGVNIGWPELKHGAKHLKTPEYLVLLKHGPALYGPNAADMLARCIANNESLAKDVIASQAVVNIRPRLLAAVSSMKPELASVKAEAVGQTKANPFFAPSKGPNFDQSF